MTVRIGFNLKGKGVADVKIKGNGSDLEKRTVQIGELVADGGKANAPNRLHIQNITGNAALASTEKGITAGQVMVKAGTGKGQDTFRTVEIVCKDEKEAKKLIQLLHLKAIMTGKLEDNTANGDAHFRFWIENVKYEDGKTHTGTDFESFMKVDTNTLILNTLNVCDDDQGNGFGGLNDIKINNVVMDDGNAPDPVANQTYVAQRNKLESIWAEIDKVEKHYKEDRNDNLDADHFSDDASSPLSILKDLKAKSTTNTNPESHVYTPDSIKNIVDYWIARLGELKLWHDIVGLTKVSEILKANANGFTMSTDRSVGTPTGGSVKDAVDFEFAVQNANTTTGTAYDANDLGTWKTVKDFFPEKNKYRGFPLFDDSKQTIVDEDVADDGTHLFSKKADKGSLGNLNLKNKIDGFRTRMKTIGLKDGALPTGTEKGNTLKANWATVTDPRDCFGFFPGSTEDGGGATTGHAAEGGNATITKIMFDIINAPDKDTAIALAFRGVDYTSTTLTWKVPSPHLNLDEVRSNFVAIEGNEATGGSIKSATAGTANKVNILKNYYEATKLHAMCTWTGKKYNDAGGGGVKEEIDKAYNTTLKWAIIWDRWSGSDISDKTQAQSDKDALDKFLSENGKTADADETALVSANAKWKDEMKKIRDRADNVVKGKKTPKMPDEAKTELETLKGNATADSKVQKSYQWVLDNKGSDDKITKGVVNKLKLIIEAAEKVAKDSSTEVEIKALEDLLKKTDADEKKAAEIAKEIEIDSKKWIENLVTKARQNAQKKIKEVAEKKLQDACGGKDSVAYKAISKKLSTADDFEKAAQLFEKCKEAWKQATDDGTVATLKKSLEEFQKNTTVWNAVNEHKHETNKGYATGALEHLNGIKKASEDLVKDYKLSEDDVGTVAELEANIEKARKDPKWSSGGNKILEVSKIVKVIVKLKEKGDADKPDEKALITALKNFTKETVDTHPDYNGDANLKDPKKTAKLEQIKKDIKDKESVYNGLGGDFKKDVEALLTKIDAKINAMKEAQKNNPKENEDDSKTGDDTLWYKSTFAIISYFVIAALILGGIVWFMKKSDNADAEEQEE